MVCNRRRARNALRGERTWARTRLVCAAAVVERDERDSPADRAGKRLGERLGCRVRLWMSDKQDAFVKTIASVCPGVPHRYCGNHFLRDLAKPVLELDSHAKVQMRRKIRGLRAIEREVLKERAAAPSKRQEQNRRRHGGAGRRMGWMLCSIIVRRFVASSTTVKEAPCVRRVCGCRSAWRSAKIVAAKPSAKKRGQAETLLERLAGCIDKGRNLVLETQKQVEAYVETIRDVDATLDPASDRWAKRKHIYGPSERPVGRRRPDLSTNGPSDGEFREGPIRRRRSSDLPRDNLDLERWFRLPKGHERRIHGRCHAGVRIVQEGQR